MEFFHTVLLSLCFIKGCDLIVRSFCMSRAAIWNWYNASSDIGIIICATWQYSVSASRRWRKYITVCAWKCFFFSFSFRVLGVRGDLIQNAENYCYELSVFLSFFKRFYKYSHSSFNSSDLICCQMHANCEGAGIWTESFMSRCWCMKKKSKPPFFVMQSYHHRVSLLSRACLDFIDYQLLWWHYWFFFLYTDCVLASVFPAVFFVFRLLQPQPMNWSILPA